MKISKLKLNPLTKKVSIFLDGDFAFSVQGQVVIQHQLKLGQELEEKDIFNLIWESLSLELYTLCLDRISIRLRSEREILLYLIKVLDRKKAIIKKEVIINIWQKIYGKKITLINQIIEKLKNNNYLDDYKFAKNFLEVNAEIKKRGSIAIKTELIRKGVNKEVIENLLNENREVLKELGKGNINNLLESNYRKIAYKNYEKNKLKQILLRRLISRGYTFQEIINQIDEFIRKK